MGIARRQPAAKSVPKPTRAHVATDLKAAPFFASLRISSKLRLTNMPDVSDQQKRSAVIAIVWNAGYRNPELKLASLLCQRSIVGCRRHLDMPSGARFYSLTRGNICRWHACDSPSDTCYTTELSGATRSKIAKETKKPIVMKF